MHGIMGLAPGARTPAPAVPTPVPSNAQAERLIRLRALSSKRDDMYGPSRVLGLTEAEKKAALMVGPVLAEFGHELFIAAQARWRAHMFKRVIVSTLASRQALYEDFATEFRPHKVEVECSVVGPVNGARVDEDALRCGVVSVAEPMRIQEYQPFMQGVAEFVVYGDVTPAYAGVVVLHARNRPHVPARNWPLANWAKLVAALREMGLGEIVCIGSPKSALAVPGTRDLRGLPLRQQMNVLRSALMAIGPSSGPMHLASLCRCPHVVWCGGGAGERMNTIGRYKRVWNPHGTPVRAEPCGSWNPPAQRVIGWVREFATRLGVRA